MLKNFNLVHTEGLTGVFHKGRTIPFAKIDDTLAEQLIGKTHVLERIQPEAIGTGPLALPWLSRPPKPATPLKKKSNPQGQSLAS